MSMQTSTRKRHAVLAATAATALVALLFLVLSAVSANAGAVTATFSEVTDASATRCDNEIRSDSTCDLILRVFNTTSHPRTWTLDKILVDHAFDASTITPQTGTPGTTKTLGQCPCQYPIAAGATQTYKIHIEVGELRDGYTSGKIKVYPSAYNGGQFPPSTIANYQLDIEIATSITINTVTDTTIDLSWVGNVFATRAFIFWWPEGGTFDSVTPMTTKDSTYRITGLTPATKYQVRVQPYKSLTKYQAKQVEVTTKASATPPPTPDPTPRTVKLEDCSENVTIGSNTQGLELVLTDNTASSYCVTLGADPGGEATVDIALTAPQSPKSRIQFSKNYAETRSDDPPTLTFDSSNWNTPQLVTVHGVPDFGGTGSHYYLTHTVSGTSGPKLSVKVLDARMAFFITYRCYGNNCEDGVHLGSNSNGRISNYMLLRINLDEATTTTCADDDYFAYEARIRVSEYTYPGLYALDYLTVDPFKGTQWPRYIRPVADGPEIEVPRPLHFQYHRPGETVWSDVPDGGFRVPKEHWANLHWRAPVGTAEHQMAWYGIRVCAPLETELNVRSTRFNMWLDPTQFGKPRQTYGTVQMWVYDNGME